MSLQDAKLILTPNGYKASKLYAVKPTDGSGDATVTRSIDNVKTRVNSSGLIESLPADVLAPDYLNGACPALNVEGQATNKILQSEDYTQTNHTKGTVTVTSDFYASPKLSTQADKIVLDNITSSGFFIRNILSYEVGKTYCLSAFAKADEVKAIRLRFENGAGGFPNTLVDFDLETGEKYLVAGTPVDFDIKQYANSFYRIYISQTATATVNEITRIQLLNKISNGNYDANITGNGVDGLGLFGTVIEEGTEPSSYIPTTTAQVTRSADTVTIPIPTVTTEIIEKYEDGTTNTITTIPASPYTVPTDKRYEYILMR